MFSHLTPHFRVVDDCPPAPATWEKLADAWDLPIWTAAKRSEAKFVVTANLADGPPANENGLQVYDGVIYIHPDRLLDFLSVLSLNLDSDDPMALRGESPGDDLIVPDTLQHLLSALFS
jgi:hypothetical protein